MRTRLHRFILIAAAATLAFAMGPALAQSQGPSWDRFLNGETGGQETQRFCRYSDGSTRPAPADAPCPIAPDTPAAIPLVVPHSVPRIVIPQIVIPQVETPIFVRPRI